MDYGALPPEVNSGRMYAGPGSGPMVAAAATWDGLAGELYTTVASHASVIADLTAVWSGPASESMAGAAAPYLAWLSATAGQAERAATQAKAAAAAHETAFAMTVPPSVIAANRAQLATLIATNFFGQNFPAIAATEIQYAGMWAQDAVAMYGYAGASAGASALTAFDQPPSTTDPAGQAGQAAAVARAAETSAQSLASTPAMLQGLALPTSSPSASPAVPSGIQSVLHWLLGSSSSDSSPFKPYTGIYGDMIKLPYHHLGDWEHFMKISGGLMPKADAGAGALGTTSIHGLGGILGSQPGAPMSTSVSAGAGNAGTIGKLSVPQSWVQAAPATSLPNAAPPGGVGTAATGAKADGLLRGIPMTTAGAGGARHAGDAFSHRYGFRHRVMSRPVAGG